jgi:hypothetical protein
MSFQHLTRTRHALAAATWLLAGVWLAGCSPGVRLSDTDRNRLDDEPAIHVLHYESPLPAVKATGKTKTPAPAEVRRAAAADPAALIAQGFARLVGKKEKLKNLRVDPRHLPRPVAKEPTELKARAARGLALEIWLDDWTFAPVRGEPDQLGLQLSARGRLSRPADGRVLWSNGHCQVGNGKEYRLTAGELAQAARLRKVLAAARDECVRQLARDFYEPDTRK